MLRKFALPLLTLMLVVGAGSHDASAQDAAYRINGGDQLHISVYGEQNLNQDVVVQPDGWLSFPLAGNINALDLTLQELQSKIADNLRQSQYFPNLTDSEVTVSMLKAVGNSISVIGQVKQPGTFAFDTRLDVMQALSLAGGLTPFAGEDEIKILRRDASGKQSAIPFDYSALEEGEKLESNILLRGGDVVVVPQAGFGF
ncbi:polysaccharide biosynthesis/export family protein [Dongia sp.]|uniref:polysaccharide biosynthesis/export family protein n=1 Tax=Dongia sp. TaxID=1977262 RepID=UPI0035B14F67